MPNFLLLLTYKGWSNLGFVDACFEEGKDINYGSYNKLNWSQSWQQFYLIAHLHIYRS